MNKQKKTNVTIKKHSNIQPLANGSYRVRKSVNGVRYSHTSKSIRDAKEWLSNL